MTPIKHSEKAEQIARAWMDIKYPVEHYHREMMANSGINTEDFKKEYWQLVALIDSHLEPLRAGLKPMAKFKDLQDGLISHSVPREELKTLAQLCQSLEMREV